MDVWQRNRTENNPDQSPHMGVGIPIEGFEMRAWQPNGQGTAHEQSAPVQMPPPEVQNPIQDYERAWQYPPVQMGERNQIQGYEMGAWQENSYKPFRPFDFGVLQKVPPLELQANVQSWMHLIPPHMPLPFFDNKFQAWIVPVPIPVSLDVPPQTESDEVSVEVTQTGPLAAQMRSNVPQMGQNAPQMGPIVPQISPTGSGHSLTSGFASDFNSSTSILSRPSPGSSPGSNLGLTLGSNPETEKVAAQTWVPNPQADEFIPGGNQQEMVPNQESEEPFSRNERTNPQEKSQNYKKEDPKGGPTAQQGGWGGSECGFVGYGVGGDYGNGQSGDTMGGGYEQQGYGGGVMKSRGGPMGGVGGCRSTPYGGIAPGGGGYQPGGRGGNGGGRGDLGGY